MFKIVHIKAFMLFFILSIAVFGCQNAPKTSADKTIVDAPKVYVTLAVEGMTCGGCEKTVQGALVEIDGIDSAFASHVDKEVKILVDTTTVSLKQMQEAVNGKGYTAGDLIK